MKQVVIVAPHFPPSNLTAGHRTRYFATHLPKFGWRVKVLTVEPSYYEEKLDPDLEKLISDNYEVIRTKALPIHPLRLVGDLGIRSFLWHYRALAHIIKVEAVDMLYIPIPPNYSAMLGPLIHKRFGTPYAIDYIDPWVHTWPGCEVRFSKAWIAYHLNHFCEPIALRNVSLITGVAPQYYKGPLERYGWLNNEMCEAMPYGVETSEFTYLDQYPRTPSLYEASDGCFHFIYAGAMLPKAYDTLETLLTALANLKQSDPLFASQLRFHFVGTGSLPHDPESYMIKPWIEKYELSDIVTEYPARIPYLDVLNNLKNAHAVLIVGSWEPHYSPSKVFQAVASHRPVMALLHAQSTGVQVLKDANAGVIITFDEANPVQNKIQEIEQAIRHICEQPYSSEQIDWEKFSAYSAEAMAEKLANAFERVLRKQAE